MFKTRLIAFLLYSIYSALKFTWRIRIVESESLKRALKDQTPIIFAHWHGDELGILHLLRPYKVAAMTSTSKDGELMDRIVHHFGGRTSRGSSTRGGVSALKGIIRLSKDGWRPSVAVDGPKGPLHKVKPGVFEISRVTGGVIVPLAVECDRKFVFEKAWNKTFLPLPFAKLVAVFGEALPSVSRDSDSRDAELAQRLETALFNAKQHTSNLIAAP